ncbi:MAG TPA: hypothetical protein VKV73_14535 [Chloroflexota bacterium]|nr:hypothetical protein [Chloroflexota bacterium]
MGAGQRSLHSTGDAVIVGAMTKLQWVYVAVGLLVVVAMVIPTFMSGR